MLPAIMLCRSAASNMANRTTFFGTGNGTGSGAFTGEGGERCGGEEYRLNRELVLLRYDGVKGAVGLGGGVQYNGVRHSIHVLIRLEHGSHRYV